jgi:hypothetical protein
MVFYYAQLDENRRVHTICELAGEVEGENIVRLSALDDSVLGKYYDQETGEFM